MHIWRETMENYKVFCAQDSAFQGQGQSLSDLVKLRRPGGHNDAYFCFTESSRSVYEVVEHKPDFGSWFIGSEVLADGRMWYITEIDPVFLVLPYLQDQLTANSERYSPLDQILEGSQFPHTKRLLKTTGIKYLDVLTDVKGADDYKAYRFNQEKTLKWLVKKVDRVLTYLSESSDVQVTEGAQSADFVRSNRESPDSDAVKDYAFNVVSSYINKELCAQLRSHLGLPEKGVPVNDEVQQTKKKSKSGGPLEDYSQGFNAVKKPDQKPSALAKKLAKVDKTGIRSITSFFKPKSAQ